MVRESFSRCASPRHGVGIIQWVSQKKVEGGEAATGTDASLGQAGSAWAMGFGGLECSRFLNNWSQKVPCALNIRPCQQGT